MSAIRATNADFLEELLFTVKFFANDATRDAVLASYLVDALRDDTAAIDDLTPVLFDFASNDDLDVRVAVDQWLGAMRGNAPLARAFALLDSLRPGATCVALHPVDNEWHAARCTAVVNLAANTASLEFDNMGPLTVTVPLGDVRANADLVDNDVDAEFERLQCELCASVTRRLTDHHLYPRSEHVRLVKQGMSRTMLLTTLARICRPCHNAVHRAEDNRTLASDWNSVSALKTHPAVIRWVSFWAHKCNVA